MRICSLIIVIVVVRALLWIDWVTNNSNDNNDLGPLYYVVVMILTCHNNTKDWRLGVVWGVD